MKAFSSSKIILCIAASIAMLSCNKNKAVEPETPAVQLPDVISAEVEGATKMDIIGYVPTWKAGDEICVAGVKYRCADPAAGKFTKISGESDGTTNCCYPYSIYDSPNKFSLPYEYEQHSEIDFMPMVGWYDETNEKVFFRNLGALCRFRVKNNDSKTVYTKSFIITPTFSSAQTMTTNGKFSVAFESAQPRIIWDYTGGASHQPFMVVRFNDVVKLEPDAYHDVFAFLPPYNYNDLNLRTEAYLNSECSGQVYFSSVDLGSAEVLRNNWYDIPVPSGSWNAGVKGNGTPEAPFELGSAEDIAYINNQIKSRDDVAKNYFAQATYLLTDDISIENWNEPIACSVEKPGVKAFNGVFDGQGHTIQITKTAKYPLFFDVDGGVIKNLIIKGSFVHMREGDVVSTVTFSPFFYSAKNTCMVACGFNGTVEKFPYNPDPAITRPSIFGAMNNSCHLIGCAYMKHDDDDTPQYQAVMLNGDTTMVSDVHGVEGYTDSSHDTAITNLNTALQNWCNSSAPEEAKTDYRYQWIDGEITLTHAN